MSKINSEVWKNNLEEDVYIRLCECRNTLKDIPILAKVVVKVDEDMTPQDALDFVIEWVTDYNNQWELYDEIDKRYSKMLKEVERASKRVGVNPSSCHVRC